MDGEVIRLRPNYFVHVLNTSTNVTRMLPGPAVFTRLDHERVLHDEPQAFISIPPRHFCRISNPVVRDSAGAPVFDSHGQVKVRLGDEEVRFEQDPFPLYPGEEAVADKKGRVVQQLVVVPKNEALRLLARRDVEIDKVRHPAGDEWLFEGPGTYTPVVGVDVVDRVRAHLIKTNEGLVLRARHAFTDRSGTQRKVGEEWMECTPGAYLLRVEEEFVKTVKARVLTDKTGLHVEAVDSFTDVFGAQWLVTLADTSTYIPSVHERVVQEYCVVLDAVNADLKPQLGSRHLRRGELSFFLHPGERLEDCVKNVEVLGEKWLLFGACEYVPPVEVEIMERRKAVSLSKNEGIYVRDCQGGEAHEMLHHKELPDVTEQLLGSSNGVIYMNRETPPTQARDKTRVVTFSVQHNAAVQLYDYKDKKSRVVFGPDMVLLGPNENFTILSLSGDKPKTTHVVRALQLLLGPDFMTDIIEVETADHARLRLRLSYNWAFQHPKTEEQGHKLFAVPDFVGDACKTLASRVRGAVAAERFDTFHRHSARIIRASIFGLEGGKVRDQLLFEANGLMITNVDIQSVEPVEQKTRESLQKSVQMAIEITTRSQEAASAQDAERKDQEAKGELERQMIRDQLEAEKSRQEYLKLLASTEAIEATGKAAAKAEARAKASLIEAEASVKRSAKEGEAAQIRAQAELERLHAENMRQVAHLKAMGEMEVKKARDVAEIETKQFESAVEAIGRETIVAIAEAGPATQGFLLTDGRSPVNLLSAAQNLLTGAPGTSGGGVFPSMGS